MTNPTTPAHTCCGKADAFDRPEHCIACDLARIRDGLTLDAVTVVDRIAFRLTELESREVAGAWVAVHRDGILQVDEDTTYLFAIETTEGWEYFSDAIVWDADDEASWSSGSHGWQMEECYFRPLPAPPVTDAEPGGKPG